MRIALVGDLQYLSIENENIIPMMKQIAALQPDFAVLMGDIGGGIPRTYEGFRETVELAQHLHCPYHVILGNHDVELSPQKEEQFDSVGTYRKVFATEPNTAFVKDDVLYICLSVESQPMEQMRTIHGVYVSEEHYQWVKDQLDAHPGMPTLLIAHAPIAGNGLRCWRPTHTTSQDTYLDQTYAPERWVALLKEYPQIKACFSAHFHLGHDYETAITEADGVFHVSCGTLVWGRDTTQQTRVIDVTEDKKLKIYTLDHKPGGAFREDVTIDLTGKEKPSVEIFQVRKGDVYLKSPKATKVWRSKNLGRYYIFTDEEILWEYDPELHDLTGAIVRFEKVEDLREAPDKLIFSIDGCYYSVDPSSRARFDCYSGFAPQERTEEENPIGEPVPEVPFENISRRDGNYVQFEV